MFIVNEEKCIGCGKCVGDCFPSDIKMNDGKAFIRNKTCIACGHCIAICPINAVTTDSFDMSEVVPYNAETFDIEPETLMNFIKFRRSVRKFKAEPVTRKQLDTIIESGRFTQTGGNLQDVAYVVVEKDLKALKDLTYESLNEAAKFFIKEVEDGKRKSSGYAKLWLKMYDAYKADPENNDRLFFNAPVIIIVTANSTVNGALASSNMELMTNALGLGTMFSGFFIRALQMNTKICDFIGVTDASKVATCMVIGHPAVKYERTVPRNQAIVSWR